VTLFQISELIKTYIGQFA